MGRRETSTDTMREQREESAIEKRVFLKANLPRHTETHISPE